MVGGLIPKTQGFNALVQADWLKGKRNMRLTRDLVYTDKNGREWYAYAGDIVDGQVSPGSYGLSVDHLSLGCTDALLFFMTESASEKQTYAWMCITCLRR